MSQETVLAELDEGKRILEILETSPAKGAIELLYTRRPNAYESYHKESDDVRVHVIKDEEAIIATSAEIIRDVYINGEVKKLSYLCGLKKDPYYNGVVNFGKLFFKSLTREDIDCYFCSVVEDNKEARALFEKRRKRVMNMDYLQTYTTYMFKPYFKFKVDENNFEFKKVEKCDEKSVLKFLNEEGKNKNFFPVISSLEQFTDLSASDFYILKKDDEIIACGALWNQTNYRQYIVKKYNGVLKLVRWLNPLISKMGYIKLPKEDETLNFPMLSFLISKDDNDEYYKLFLNHILAEIRKDYDMFVIGSTENSCLNKILKDLKSIKFNTKIYAIDFVYGKGKVQEVDGNKLWLECGLL